MSGLCIYHGGCTDGVAAAWAIWKKFPTWKFYPGVYQKEPPYDLIAGAEEVVFVDFSYKQNVMRKVAKAGKRLTVLDHHKTARDDLIPLFEEGVIDAGEFDMGRCGALMAWDYYHDASARPPLLMKVDAQDRFTPDRDAATIMALRSYAHKPDDDTVTAWQRLMIWWDWLMTDEGFNALSSDGQAIHRYYRARVEETKPHAAPVDIGEYKGVPVVNAPFYLASDVAGELAVNAPDGIAAVWWLNKDGSVTFSLRSRGEVDVGKLATSFGGGGHPGAAGFRMDSLFACMSDTRIDGFGAVGEECPRSG